MVLTGIREMEMQEVPDPEICRSDDVLLKMAAVGVCGSDIHYYTRGRIGDQVIEYPFTVGHEGSAVVQEVGERVTCVKPGDPVVFDPLIICGECPQCLAGRKNTCLNARFLGCPGQLEGCLSEYIVMPEACCFVIPEKTYLTEAIFIEPLSIGIYANRMLGPLTEKDVGILGVGPIGLSTYLAAKDSGCRSIYATDKIDERLSMAKHLGADGIANPDKVDVVKAILDERPMGLDVVFECCGDQEALDQAVDLLKPGGTLSIIGIPMEYRISFNISLLRRKEISIENVRRQNECIPATIDFFRRNHEKIASLITHRFTFEETQEAFDLVARYGDGVVKAVVELEP